MKKASLQLFALLLPAALSSCTHKELFREDDSPVEVRVVYDWESISEAEVRTGMSLYLFSEDGSSLPFHFPDPEGGTIEVSSGDWRAVSVSTDLGSCVIASVSDSEGIAVQSSDMTSISGIALNTLPRVASVSNERFGESPSMHWSVLGQDVSVSAPMQNTLTFCPEDNLCHYSVQILSVSNLSSVKTMFATLSSLAGGFLLSSGVPSSEKVTYPFALGLEVESSAASAEFLTFGVPYGGSDSHTLTVYAIYDNGERWYYTYDVTGQVSGAANPKSVRIVLDRLPLPASGGEGGFTPGVDKWSELEIEITI